MPHWRVEKKCGGTTPPHSKKLFDVQDFLECVDIGVDEEAAIDFDSGIRSEVERLAVILVGLRQLVRHAILRQKTLDQTALLFSTSGEKPYGHPPLPFPPGELRTVLDDQQTVGPFRRVVK